MAAAAAARQAALLLLISLLLGAAVQAADPDPVQDFCIADTKSSLHANGFLCTDSSSAQGGDFSSQILRNISQVEATNGLNFTLVTASSFPGLNTLGLAIVRVDFGPNGVVPLHTHPRSSELIYVEAGTVRAGFVDTNNKLFQQTLQKGDMLIVPRGLLHFQWNVGSSPATVLAVFNSQNPGTQILGTGLFGSQIPDAVLRSSFMVNETIVAALTGAFSS